MATVVSQVIGTVRLPDGRVSGSLDGLVTRERGLLVVITMERAWSMASSGQLQAVPLGSKTPALLEAIGQRGEGGTLRLLDAQGADDIPNLPIWDRERACWVNPFRPDGPPLPGPMP